MCDCARTGSPLEVCLRARWCLSTGSELCLSTPDRSRVWLTDKTISRQQQYWYVWELVLCIPSHTSLCVNLDVNECVKPQVFLSRLTLVLWLFSWVWFWDENSSCTILQKRITIFFCIHPQEVQKYALFILINVYFWLKHWLRTPPTSIRTHRSYDGSVPHDFLVSSVPLSTLRMLISAVYLPMSEHTETVCSFGHLYL